MSWFLRDNIFKLYLKTLVLPVFFFVYMLDYKSFQRVF